VHILKVGLFLTCINDGLYPGTGIAVVNVLESLGHTVIFPTQQTCCGQMHLNSGYRREGLHAAEHFRNVFGSFDAIVSPSASCVGTVRATYADAARAVGDPSLASDLEDLSKRVFEFSEFLTNVLDLTDVGASFPHRVAYHPTCHSLRVLGIKNGPRVLLNNVRGLEYVDIPNADECCGFGGTFALKNAATSVAIGIDKVKHAQSSSVEVLCALDNSCLTHIGGIASRKDISLRTMHLAEILASHE
jgi:L-lactate dehydrogenase complex protein LldE